MNTNKGLNLTMLFDFYEMTMANGYFLHGYKDRVTYYDLFFRRVPDGGGFAIAAGLEQVIDYINELHFDEADIDYLRGRGMFSEDFLDYLRNFKFTGDVWAVPEGTPVFPKEPLITVRAPAIQAQLLETYLLLATNHQSLIATKANRICRQPRGGRSWNSAPAAPRAATGPCSAPARLTSAAALALPPPSPISSSASRPWAPWPMPGCRCLTTSSMPSALIAKPIHQRHLAGGYLQHPQIRRSQRHSGLQRDFKASGIRKCGIRLDSGDIAYLSRKARQMLDEAGWTECTITASNSLDEYLIRDLDEQGARIDAYGVGERMITARSEPVFGSVYKLVAVENADGSITPKIKISENVEKITVPHYKKLWRFYGNSTGKAIADYMTLHDETVDDSQNLRIFDPENTWKAKEVYDFTARELQVPIFQGGRQVYQCPPLEQVRSYCAQQVDTLWDEVKRFDNPHKYYVDLSQKLWDLRQDLLRSKP